MSTIANAKVAHNYNRYNGHFFGCLQYIIKKLKTYYLLHICEVDSSLYVTYIRHIMYVLFVTVVLMQKLQENRVNI